MAALAGAQWRTRQPTHSQVSCNHSTLTYRYVPEYEEHRTAHTVRMTPLTMYILNVSTRCVYNLLLVGGGGSGTSGGGGGGGGDVLYFKDVVLEPGMYNAVVGGGGIQSEPNVSGTDPSKFSYEHTDPQILRMSGGNSLMFSHGCARGAPEQSSWRQDAPLMNPDTSCHLSLCSAGGGAGQTLRPVSGGNKLAHSSYCLYYSPYSTPSNSTAAVSSGGAGGFGPPRSEDDRNEDALGLSVSPGCAGTCPRVSGHSKSGGGGGAPGRLLCYALQRDCLRTYRDRPCIHSGRGGVLSSITGDAHVRHGRLRVFGAVWCMATTQECPYVGKCLYHAGDMAPGRGALVRGGIVSGQDPQNCPSRTSSPDVVHRRRRRRRSIERTRRSTLPEAAVCILQPAKGTCALALPRARYPRVPAMSAHADEPGWRRNRDMQMRQECCTTSPGAARVFLVRVPVQRRLVSHALSHFVGAGGRSCLCIQ